MKGRPRIKRKASKLTTTWIVIWDIKHTMFLYVKRIILLGSCPSLRRSWCSVQHGCPERKVLFMCPLGRKCWLYAHLKLTNVSCCLITKNGWPFGFPSSLGTQVFPACFLAAFGLHSVKYVEGITWKHFLIAPESQIKNEWLNITRWSEHWLFLLKKKIGRGRLPNQIWALSKCNSLGGLKMRVLLHMPEQCLLLVTPSTCVEVDRYTKVRGERSWREWERGSTRV